MVSIIIPLYNNEAYIAETIKSCLDQTYRDIEIILVDDGSSDDSAKLALSFSDERLHYYFQENNGASSARNHGLKYAKGSYIQYLDSDDILHPQKIEKQIQILDQLPEGYIVNGPWGVFGDQIYDSVFNTQEVWKDYDYPAQWLIDSWNGGGMMQTACWLVPTNIVTSAGPWKEELSLHDDGEYFTRIILKSKGLKYVEESKVFYRQVKDSLSRDRSADAISSAYKVTEFSVSNLLDYEPSEEAKEAASRHFGRYAYEFFQIDKKLAEQALSRSKALYSTRKISIGPWKFKLLKRVFGFHTALKLRSFLIKST